MGLAAAKALCDQTLGLFPCSICGLQSMAIDKLLTHMPVQLSYS